MLETVKRRISLARYFAMNGAQNPLCTRTRTKSGKSIYYVATPSLLRAHDRRDYPRDPNEANRRAR